MTTLESYTLSHGITVDELRHVAETNGYMWDTTFAQYDKPDVELLMEPNGPVKQLLEQLAKTAVNLKLSQEEVFSTMNGLQKWAALEGTSAEEIKALALASNLDWNALFSQYEVEGCEIPTGRDVAIRGLMERGANDDIKVKLSILADIMGMDVDTVVDVTKTSGYVYYPDRIGTPPSQISGDSEVPGSILKPLLWELDYAKTGSDEARAKLEDMVKKNKGNTGTEQPPAPPAPTGNTDKPEKSGRQRKPATPKTDKPKIRKTKYSLTKNAIVEMLQPKQADMPTRDIRAFLLSLPDYKPNDVALMNDDDVIAAFTNNYKAVLMGSGSMIIPNASYDELVALLSGIEAYYIPAAEPPEANA